MPVPKKGCWLEFSIKESHSKLNLIIDYYFLDNVYVKSRIWKNGLLCTFLVMLKIKDALAVCSVIVYGYNDSDLTDGANVIVHWLSLIMVSHMHE